MVVTTVYCCHNCDASFTYCFVTCVSTWVSTCFILRDAKSMTLFPRAQVQYVWIALWCISTAKPHSLATLRITEEVSEVADINCYCCAQECWGTILQHAYCTKCRQRSSSGVQWQSNLHLQVFLGSNSAGHAHRGQSIVSHHTTTKLGICSILEPVKKCTSNRDSCCGSCSTAPIQLNSYFRPPLHLIRLFWLLWFCCLPKVRKR